MASTIGTSAGNPAPFYGLNYTADAQVWVCPSTSYTLGHGFLAMYQGLRGPMGLCATQILGLPISAEYSVTIGGGSVVRQDFERGSLIWDERQAEPWKCYFSAIGNEAQQVKSLQEQLAGAERQITDLRQQLAVAQAPQPSPASASAPTAAEIAEVTVRALAAALSSGHQ